MGEGGVAFLTVRGVARLRPVSEGVGLDGVMLA